MTELTIPLEVKSKIPLYEQIYQYIKENIERKKIACYEKLPSTRALASYLEVSRSTVELAYEQLLSEGYIESVAYKGYYVTNIEELYQLDIKAPKQSKEEKKLPEEQYTYDFTSHGVDKNGFPHNIWKKLAKEVYSEEASVLSRQGDSQGEYMLREEICEYLYQARGVQCSARQVIIASGSDYFVMLLSLILGKNKKIAFEDPAYKRSYKVFEALGHQLCAIPVDKKGMKVSELKESETDIAYVTPSHQYPLGIVMPLKRRAELLQWVKEKEGRYIIEDDYDSEFRYKGKPIPSLQGYDKNGKVIYMGNFSKSISPSIRVGYMVLPDEILELYYEKKAFLNVTVSKETQLTLGRFLAGGHYARHLNKMRALYKSRHDTLIGALKPMLKNCSISGENAGVHILLEFPSEAEEKELIEKAKQQGIRVYGLSEYYLKNIPKNNTILLGFVNMSEEKIKEAVEKLIEIWN